MQLGQYNKLDMAVPCVQYNTRKCSKTIYKLFSGFNGQFCLLLDCKTAIFISRNSWREVDIAKRMDVLRAQRDESMNVSVLEGEGHFRNPEIVYCLKPPIKRIVIW